MGCGPPWQVPQGPAPGGCRRGRGVLRLNRWHLPTPVRIPPWIQPAGVRLPRKDPHLRRAGAGGKGDSLVLAPALPTAHATGSSATAVPLSASHLCFHRPTRQPRINESQTIRQLRVASRLVPTWQQRSENQVRA